MIATKFDGCWEIRDDPEDHAYIHVGDYGLCLQPKVGYPGPTPEIRLPPHWGICLAGPRCN